jgi:hypothetical protein
VSFFGTSRVAALRVPRKKLKGSPMNVAPTISGLTPGGLTIPSTPPGGGSSVSVSGGGFGLLPLAGALIEVLAVLILLALVGVFVIIVVANRAEPDPSGRRPQSVYCFAISFITLSTSIIGSAVVVSGVVRLAGNHSGSITNSVARTIVIGGLITLISLALLIIHLRRGLVLARAEEAVPSPSQRIGQSYVAAVAFLSILSLLVIGIVATYLVFALAGPGVFGSFGGRGQSARVLVVAAYLGVIAGVVLRAHRNLVPPGLHLFPGRRDAGAPPSAPEPAAPSAATPL